MDKRKQKSTFNQYNGYNKETLTGSHTLTCSNTNHAPVTETCTWDEGKNWGSAALSEKYTEISDSEGNIKITLTAEKTFTVKTEKQTVGEALLDEKIIAGSQGQYHGQSQQKGDEFFHG